MLKIIMKTGKYIALFALLLTLTLAVNLVLDNWHYKEGDHRRLQKEIDKKIKQSDRIYDRLQINNWQLDAELPGSTGIILVAYLNDSLEYWSDNTLNFNSLKQSDFEDKRFAFISNGWYIIRPYVNDSLRAYGLILLKSEYSYDNKFLDNGFHPYLRLPASTELFTEPQPGSYSIHDWEGIYLFSIKFSMNELRFSNLEKYLIPSLILLTLLSLLLLVHQVVQMIRKAWLRNLVILLLPVFFGGLRWIMYRYHIPDDFYDLELFGPIPFGKSVWLPSLGDVFINTLFILFIMIQFFLGFKLPDRVYKGRNPGSTITISILLIFLAVFFVYTHSIISNLIFHSIISFEFYKAASLSIYTFVCLVIMVMHFAVILLIANKLLAVCKLRCKFTRLILLLLGICGGIFFIFYLFEFRLDTGTYISFFIIFMSLAILQYRKVPLGNYSAMAIMVILFSAYSVYLIGYYNNKKVMNNMTALAENLAAQHDPVAEYLLEDISSSLVNDETLNNYMFNWNISWEEIHIYLQSNYFNGFWGKYKFSISDCMIAGNDTMDCYNSIHDILDDGKSMQLPDSKFYFRDRQNGRINYVGWINYKRPGRKNEILLFIELESRLVAEELGFPDLLLDEKYQTNKLLEDYSYAKYYKNQLMAQSGLFQYSLDLNTYRNRPANFGGFNHYISDPGNDNTVMVSRQRTTFFNNLVSFSYIFIFYYIIVIFFIVIRDFSTLGRDIEFNFKNKIQLSITSLILLSLFLVGGGTIYFSIEQYQKKQHDILSEKIQSVYAELDHLLAYFPERIPPDWQDEDGEYDNLNQLLIKFSDVFYSDINLYNPQGNLIASSRQQIFDEGLLGERMDPMAYSAMVNEKQAEYIHRETIGELSFISAYVPLVNVNNKLLAYINLPYFTKQNILRNDVTTLVVAIINVYVLLILLAIAMAAIISEEITKPLRMIQQRFSQIKLGRKSEPIEYKGHDEIAGLVNEYNRMMKELVRSVELLARSERESAWREMAKQVAHEIKNPLTPMKLSVQHLQRSWNDNRENFDEFLEKVTRTLIEQIDNLSFIASEFGNFAKMPKAMNEELNIVDSIRSSLNLFGNTENVDFVFEHESIRIPVFADKEQLSRVFINLIKNAIQSIPDNRNGKIVISLVQNRKTVRISITDNGKGIPEDLQNKLFTPSFTTKSSGMGLGLSIVKSIIESFGGNITFKTKVNLGTTFVIELPIYHQVESEVTG
jgi:two-component system nitrogen regulation sensor histidine kinase NtrY